MTYRRIPLEEWFGIHPALKDSYIWSDDGWFAEMKAMRAHGMNEGEWFRQDRLSRAMYTGGLIAEGALQSMQSHDNAEEQKARREAEDRAKGR